MNTGTKFQPNILLFMSLTLIGVIIGLVLSALAVWADYEATAYGFMRRAQTPFSGLRCPVFMGNQESRVVTVTVANPTDEAISPSVRTEISTRLVMDEKLEFINLAPQEQVTLQRTVGPDNIDLGNFIFVYALAYSAYPMPDQENTCGIFVLPMPINGSWFLAVATTLSVLLMGAGIWFLSKNQYLIRRSRSVLFLGIATILAMGFSFTGLWLQAVLVLVLLILTLVITIGSFLR